VVFYFIFAKCIQSPALNNVTLSDMPTRNASPIWPCPQVVGMNEKEKRKREKFNHKRPNKSVEQRA